MSKRRIKPVIPPPPRYTVQDAIGAMHIRHLYEGRSEEDWSPPPPYLEDWRETTDEFGATEFAALDDEGKVLVRVTFLPDWDGFARIEYANGRTVYIQANPDDDES